jgi:hypothetical protein
MVESLVSSAFLYLFNITKDKPKFRFSRRHREN